MYIGIGTYSKSDDSNPFTSISLYVKNIAFCFKKIPVFLRVVANIIKYSLFKMFGYVFILGLLQPVHTFQVVKKSKAGIKNTVNYIRWVDVCLS